MVSLDYNIIKKGVNTNVMAIKITVVDETDVTVEVPHGLSITPDFAHIQEITPAGDASTEDRIVIEHTGAIGTDAKVALSDDGQKIKVFVPGIAEGTKKYRGLLIVGRVHSIAK